MAKAFIASIPLALILLAALTVPTILLPPGSLHFHSWPGSGGEQVSNPQVRIPSPRVSVVSSGPGGVVPGGKRSLASVPTPKAGSHSIHGDPRGVAVHAPSRHNTHGEPHATPGHGSTPAAPQPQPQQPQPAQPQPAETTPPAAPSSDDVASDESPILRDDPSYNPVVPPPPPPIEIVPPPAPDPPGHGYDHHGVVGLVLGLLPGHH
jgi:hypothetical protein